MQVVPGRVTVCLKAATLNFEHPRTDRQTDRQTDRYTIQKPKPTIKHNFEYRHTGTHTDRHTHIHIHTHAHTHRLKPITYFSTVALRTLYILPCEILVVRR